MKSFLMEYWQSIVNEVVEGFENVVNINSETSSLNY